MSDQSPVTGLAFPCVYVDDIDAARAFYEKHLGFEVEQTHPDGALFGTIGPCYLWIGGGYESRETTGRSVRTTTMLQVESTSALLQGLRDDGQTSLQEAPVKMAEDMYWLQFTDPAGNILEVLGGE
jgi:catechol 2,3-dioxygenase-like lactoylglutathione lyase family enzyme